MIKQYILHRILMDEIQEFKKSGIKRQVEIKKPIKVEIEEKPVILSNPNAKKIFEKMKRAG